MKTRHYFLLFSIFACTMSAWAQYDFEAIERARMARARVKTQTQWTHEYTGGRPAARGYKSAVMTYDTRGNIIEQVNYNASGNVISTITYRFDNRNNLIRLERFNDKRELRYSQIILLDAAGNKVRESGFNGNAQYVNTFTYDTNNRLIEIRYTEANAQIERRTFRYSGNKAELSVFGANDALQYHQENIYNDQGLLVSEVRRGGAANAIIHTLNMQYNNIGDLVEEIRRRGDNRLDYQRIIQYDSSSRPIRIESVNPDGVRFVAHEYQFNAQGNLIHEAWKRNNRGEMSTKKLTYDNRNLCVEEDCFFASFNLNTLYKYTYDFH